MTTSMIIRAKRAFVKLPQTAHQYYYHGWQSWSLAAWADPTPLPVPAPAILHPLQNDPVYVRETSPHGSWVGAVRLMDGKVFLLGALDLETHVRLASGFLEGWSETGEADWLIALGKEDEVFSCYADHLKKRFGARVKPTTLRIWCSWYSLYNQIDEKILQEVLDRLGDLPFDVFQVDDGWQKNIGDWQANKRFPSGMKALADRIRSSGRKAGLWLAPLLAVKSSKLFHDHPQWFLKNEFGGYVSAGFNWGEPLMALDTTHPEALAWLKDLMRQVRDWGFDYVKLDFLYAAGLPGRRFVEMPRESAYRQALLSLREALGEDAFLLACGAPIIPSLGICDALRVGPDVSGEWENVRDAVLLYNPAIPGMRNAIRTTLNRLWLKTLVTVDPDVVYFTEHGNSLSGEQKQLMQDLARICCFKATSDLPQWLDEGQKKALRDYLKEPDTITQTDLYHFSIGSRMVDFSRAIALPKPPRGIYILLYVLISWIVNSPWVMKMYYGLNQRAIAKRISSLH